MTVPVRCALERRVFLFVGALLLSGLCVTARVASASSSVSQGSTEPLVMTAFLCADSGDYSGAHELGFLHDALEDRETLALSPCQSAYRGFIRHADGTQRIPALVVTTGIGYVSAALCTRRVLNWERANGHVKLDRLVWIGTSGFSPMVGGWDPTNTSRFREEAAALHALQAALEVDSAVSGAAEAAEAVTPALTMTPEEYANHTASRAAAGARPVEPLLVRHVNFERFGDEAQLDADGCAPRVMDSVHTSKDATTSIQPLAVGSICVTSSAFLQESAYCTETVEANQCSRPHCYGFARETINRYVMDDSFAREIVAASEGKAFPPVPDAVRSGMQQFWYANEAVTVDRAAVASARTGHGEETNPEGEEVREAVRRAVGDVAADLTPTFVTCAESTMNAIFVGAERDYLCREHTAEVLSLAERHFAARHGRTPHRFTADEVVCVQAMEAFGFLQSVDAHAPGRAVAVIRTASNYDMYPQQKLYLSEAHVARLRKADQAGLSSTPPTALLGPEARTALAAQHSATDAHREDNASRTHVVSAYVWSQNTGYVRAEDYDAFVMASFHYSVKTAAFVLSNYFFGGRDFATAVKAR